MGRLGSVVAVAASALALSISTAPAHAAFPGQNGKIALVKELNDPASSHPEIYAVDPATGAQTNLTDNPAEDRAPAYSPDGRTIVFSSMRPAPCSDCNFEIYRMNSDGSGVEQLTDHPAFDDHPSFSPDGTRIAFLSGRNGPFGLFVMNVDGSEVRSLGVSGYTPAWSPDGSKIAFYSPSTDTIHLVGPDGTGHVDLGVDGAQHSWSPDGSKIAYATLANFSPDEPGDFEIFSMNADGSGQTNLTLRADVDDGQPVWSPDGSKIAFNSFRDGVAGLYIMDADGGNPTNVTSDGLTYYNEVADWQPIPYQATPAPTYDHPSLATRLSVSLVPNFRQTISSSQCLARGGVNSNHGPPLSFSSCQPPGFGPGTQAFFGDQTSGKVQYGVIYGDSNAANGDQANVALAMQLDDVENGAGSDYDPAPSGSDITVVTRFRLSDRFNGTGQSDPATVQDVLVQTPVSCVPDSDPQVASTCNLDTTLDAQNPGAVRENRATVAQLHRVLVFDSGTDAVRGNVDDRIFAVQGIYIP